jgi:hypothetical protein
VLPDHLCRRDVPGLGEAVLARDYAVLEGLDEDEVLASIRGRRVLGTLYRGEWYVEAPAFCEERLELLRQQECRSTSHPQPLRRTSTASITEEELSHARVLGLRSKVTLDDIKRCYRERMQEYHPDKVSSLGQKLRELADAEAKKINLAYEFFNVKRATAFQRCEPLGMSPL